MPKGCTDIIQWHPRSINGHLPRVWTRIFRTCPQILTVKLLTIQSMNFTSHHVIDPGFHQWITVHKTDLIYTLPMPYQFFKPLTIPIFIKFHPKKPSQKFPVPLPLYGKPPLDHRCRRLMTSSKWRPSASSWAAIWHNKVDSGRFDACVWTLAGWLWIIGKDRERDQHIMV